MPPTPSRTQLLALGGAVAAAVAGIALIAFGVAGMVSGGGPGTAAEPVPTHVPRHPPVLTEPADVLARTFARPMGRSVPRAVYISRIGVAAPLMQLGLDAEGAIENPPLSPANIAGWYRHGPAPGQSGPAVITGHLDTRTGPAVFARLDEVRRGDQIHVMRSDGSVAVFVVDKRERVAKEDFPTARVYGDVDYPGLRLVTCGGVFDRGAHSYRDNTIVYAHLVRAYHPPG
ncbi:class F sortase [Planobispora siamensis]|uniref:Class F sortase n=1 Tax=Planobispora siamensis TaxID=936338 RepID=A0A8J3SDC9_9ACTN|nr:class F sortase [Planobispora siamensis]GIH90747.1 class F sortase [Planobispora siamensis]